MQKIKADQEKVEKFFDETGISNLAAIQDDNGNCEPYFSWSTCDCCGGLPGDRYDANGFNRATKEIHEFSVCADCIYYAEYGQLDDMTMMVRIN